LECLLTEDEEARFIELTIGVEKWDSFVKNWDPQAQYIELDSRFAFSF
jgi:hypothetical protein